MNWYKRRGCPVIAYYCVFNNYTVAYYLFYPNPSYKIRKNIGGYAKWITKNSDVKKIFKKQVPKEFVDYVETGVWLLDLNK